jgi:hypothetical protein
MYSRWEVCNSFILNEQSSFGVVCKYLFLYLPTTIECTSAYPRKVRVMQNAHAPSPKEKGEASQHSVSVHAKYTPYVVERKQRVQR